MRPVYDHAGIQIYHGDCREILPHLPKVDLVLTDPPYGIGIAKTGRVGGNNAARAGSYIASDWDDAAPDRELLGAIRAAGAAQLFWGANHFELPPSRGWLVWDKDNTGNFSDCELAWTSLDQGIRKLRYRWNGMLQEPGREKETRVHPTQKPVQVMTWCLSFFPDAQTVLDPFGGSGTTMVACKQLGKRGIMIEIEEKYVEIAIQRLAQEVMDFG